MKLQVIDFVQFLIGYAFFLISAAVHESAHAWTAFKFGDPTAKLQNRISLNPAHHIDLVGSVLLPAMGFFSGIPLIGWARPTPIEPANFSNPRKANFYVSGAGPISNLLAVFLLVILWHVAWSFTNGDLVVQRNELIPVLFCYVLSVGIGMNLMLMFFNLIPIHPLDGSGVMESLLPEFLARPYRKIGRYGFLILIGLFYLVGLGTMVWILSDYIALRMGVIPIPLKALW